MHTRAEAATMRCSLTRVAPLALFLVAMVACSPGDIVGSGDLPGNILDPAAAKTPAGALAAYHGALVQLSLAFAGDETKFGGDASYVATSGLLSDELQTGDLGAPVGTSSSTELVDARTLPEYTDPSFEPAINYRPTYSALQAVRGQAREAMGLLAAYAPDSPQALRGQLYAVQAYSEVMLSELFCSGIPLSTVDYDGNYTLKPGATTDEVLQHAIVLFDSALALTADSERVMNLEHVGRARALLDLGRFADAAQEVGGIGTDFRYAEVYSDQFATASQYGSLGYISPGFAWFGSVSDREGNTGLSYVSSGDPRTLATPSGGTNHYGNTLLYPNKLSQNGEGIVVLADGIEARLIEAEASLQTQNSSWLSTLNTLRTSCTDAESCPTPAPPGTGGVSGLPPLTDPVNSDARVDLLFQERAMWLFLTGHRQGDLRRLIRQYGRTPSDVYPSGSYRGGSGVYGSDITAPIPASERAFNPQFTGCKNRGA
jgi:hypothetical protein